MLEGLLNSMVTVGLPSYTPLLMTGMLTGIPQSNIRAIPAEIGGGFGAKTIIYLEPLATVLSRKATIARPHMKRARLAVISVTKAAIPNTSQ